MRTINTALCSFGMSGRVFHAPFIHAHAGFHLHAVLERSKNLATEKYPGVRIYHSLDQLLRDAEVELVIVNTPNATHFDFAKRALSAGKHVVVEKPFTVMPGEAEELIALASRQRRVLSVYHNRRWDSDFLTVRKVIDEKRTGEVVEAEFHFDRYKEALSPKAHKETPGPGAGILYDLGSHLVDQALQLFGMPDAVFADIAVMRNVSLVDDYFELVFFYNHLRVRMKATYVAREPVPSYIVHGTKGSFLKSRADVQESDLQSGRSPLDENWGTETETQRGLLHTSNEGCIVKEHIPSERGNYMFYYDDLYHAITTGQPPAVTADDGLKVIKLIRAAVRSNDEKKVIDLRE